jgi:hypothetical protein
MLGRLMAWDRSKPKEDEIRKQKAEAVPLRAAAAPKECADLVVRRHRVSRFALDVWFMTPVTHDGVPNQLLLARTLILFSCLVVANPTFSHDTPVATPTW